MVDVLWTDYSSIFVDFLTLNKPIVFLHFDKKKYLNLRGFMDELYNLKFPGTVVNNINELLNSIGLEKIPSHKDANIFNSINGFDIKLFKKKFL